MWAVSSLLTKRKKRAFLSFIVEDREQVKRPSIVGRDSNYDLEFYDESVRDESSAPYIERQIGEKPGRRSRCA